MNASAASRNCPVCGTSAHGATVFFGETIDKSRLNEFSFASRKAPEYMSHRMVRCPDCDLVYVDRPPHHDELARAYHQADFDSTDEADDAAAAYIRAIAATLARLPRRGSALEIGTGTGVFLQHLEHAGFGHLVGIEPSRAAISAASRHVRPWIRESIFVADDYAPASFDLVCCFMTLEHLPDPGATTRAALQLLRPGGAFAVVVHDYCSVVNRMLGRRSPIVDVEHLQLFTTRSVRRLLECNGFRDVSVAPFVNTYALAYWLRLMPLPSRLKSAAMAHLSKSRLGRKRLSINVGNLMATGFKPPVG